MITMGDYYAETLLVVNLLCCPIKNIALNDVIKSSDDGTIIISFGNALGQIYLSAMAILVRFVIESHYTNTEGNLLDPQIWNVIISSRGHFTNSLDIAMIPWKTRLGQP